MPERLLDFSTGAQRWLPNMEQANANDAVRAGNTFDNRIMTEALPIDRMIGEDGKVDVEAINKQNAFPDPDEMWKALQDDLAGTGRSVDPVMFQEKYKAGEQIFKENKFKEIDFMRRSGMSDKEIRKAIGTNKNLIDYIYRNPEIGLQPPKSFDFGGLGKGAAVLGAGIGGTIAAERGMANLMNRTFSVKPSSELSQDLRKKGFQRKGKFGIKKLSDRQISRDLGIIKDEDLRPKKADGTPNKRYKKKLGISTESKQKIKDFKKQRDERLKNSRQLRKAVAGSKSAGGRVLRNTSTYITRTPSFALKAAKIAKKIPRYGGLLSAGILGGAALGGAVEKLFKED